MVNAPTKNVTPHPAGRYGKSTKQWIRWRHQAIERKSGFDAERFWALGALRSLWSKKKLAAEKWWEMHFLSNGEKEKWIDIYGEGETVAVGKQGEDP